MPLLDNKPVPLVRDQVTMQFVDTYKEDEPPPPQPTPLIGAENNRASQPEPPDKPVLSKGQPHKKDISDSKQVKTRSEPKAVGKVPHVSTVAPTPQTEQFDSTQQTTVQKETKNLIKDDILEKKEVQVKRNELTVAKKTVEQPEEIIEKIAKETPLTEKHTPSPPQQMPGGASNNVEKTPLDGKIDELIHQSKSDTESVAELIDEIRFNIMKHNLGEYYARMKRKISRNWQTRIMLNYGSEMFASRAFIVFKIDEGGEIEFIKILDYQGNPFFSKDCEAAIIESAKFEPLPEEYVQTSGKKDLWLFMTFGYNTE